MRISLLDDVAAPDLRLLSDAVQSLGVKVDPTTDPDHLRQSATEGKADSLIVDYRLPTLNGPVFNGAELVALAAAESRLLPTVLLTNHRGECDSTLARLDPRLQHRVQVVLKPTSHHTKDWIEALRAPVSELRDMSGEPLPEPLGVPVASLTAKLFHLSAAEVHELSEDDRDDLDLEAASELAGWLGSVWEECDSDWVMVSRIDDSLLVLGRGADSGLLTSFQLSNREAELDAPCLVIGRPAFLEEGFSAAEQTIPPPNCTPGRGKDWRRYPFARVRFSTLEREFHVDTGSSQSYLSFEFLLEDGEHTPSTTFKAMSVADLHSNNDIVKAAPLAITISVIGPFSNAVLRVTVQAIKRWSSARNALNAPCTTQLCPGSRGGQCGRRYGVFGRDILYALYQGRWTFDPAEGRFYIGD